MESKTGIMHPIKLLFISFVIFFSACKEEFPVIDDLSNSNYSLLNQNGDEVVFPALVKGKLTVMGFIFTNCPDICPLTTNNMRMIQEKLKKENISGVEFVSLSFDPEFDTPLILNKYAKLRKLDLSNWVFLTGEKETIKELIKQAGVVAVVGDSTVFKNGKKIYYYVHTDRIALIDKEGRIRKNYIGSNMDINEIVNDIKNFGD